jgi:uncharacterized protein YkwD
MGVLDRDYMNDKDAANKPRWADVAVPLDVLKREKRIKRLTSFLWSILVIGLLAAAVVSPQSKDALNCKAGELVLDANRDGRFTYSDVGGLALQVTALPLKVARQRPELDSLISFFEIKPGDCTSPKAIIFSGALLLTIGLLIAWLVSIGLLVLRHGVKYLLFDLLKVSPFGRWNAIVFRYTYPRFVWVLPLTPVVLLCAGLTALLLLKTNPTTTTGAPKSQTQPAQIGPDRELRSASEGSAHIKADTSGVTSSSTYEHRLMNALIEVRRAGCKGKPGISQPMQHTDGMDLLARLVVDGKLNYEERLKEAKYLAFGGAGVRVERKASPELTGREAGIALCPYLLDPSLTVAGVATTKTNAHVHVARQFNPPTPNKEIEVNERFLAKVNLARQAGYTCGKKYYSPSPPLKLNDVLSKAARLHAEDLFNHPGISHRGSDGSTPTERAQRAGYRFPVGENLTNLSDRPEDAVQSLLESPGHCANIMNPDFNEVGLGYFIDATRMPGIVWVQKLGAASN